MYSPSVASSDSMMSRKITFVNTSVIWRGLPSPAATVWILLNASKNAAVCQEEEKVKSKTQKGARKKMAKREDRQSYIWL